jgi:hypothetical protein
MKISDTFMKDGYDKYYFPDAITLKPTGYKNKAEQVELIAIGHCLANKSGYIHDNTAQRNQIIWIPVDMLENEESDTITLENLKYY